MSQDTISDSLNMIMNSKRKGQEKVLLKRYSKFLISILAIAKLKNYIQNYRVENNLLYVEFGNLNKIKSIKPRFTVSVDQIEKYEKRYLPARDFGILIISTSQGLMTNQTAKEKKIGGSLIAYIY